MICDQQYKRLYGLFVFLFLLLLSACEDQDSILKYAPVEESPAILEVLTVPQPTATPFMLEILPITGDTFISDNIGVAINDSETHYFKYYISFSDLRVYEEDDHCYLDAVCINGYDRQLAGKCTIVFFDKAGNPCGKGMIHTADDLKNMILSPGKNRVYSEIASENDISSFSFEINNTEPFIPIG